MAFSSPCQYFHPKPSSLTIGTELSRGAYGVVHSGRLDGKEVAIKRMHGLLLEAARGQGDMETMLGDFQRECELLEGVIHPHVVGFKGAFYDESTKEPLLVMEMMRENLRRYLERKRGHLSRQKQLQISLEIARGVRFLHARTPPVVHRDLTDKNILLAVDGVVKIGDLGQSKWKTKDYFSSGQPGAIPFMPPEALQQRSHYNEKLDIFSLGVLMLEIATQQSPCVGLLGIGTIPEVQRRREDLSKLDDNHPLGPLIRSCLKDNPKKRPDMVAVHAQLLALVEGVEYFHPAASFTQELASYPTLANEVFHTSQLLKGNPTLHSVKLPSLPIATALATAVIIARRVYVTGGSCLDIKSAQLVQVFDLDRKAWSTLPPAPQFNNQATAINNQLVLIGGCAALSQTITNIVSTWTGRHWRSNLPAMPTMRFRPGVISYSTFVIVAGGMAEDEQTLLNSIDVLDTNLQQWWTLINLHLPQPMYAMSMVVCSTHVYVASAVFQYDASVNADSSSTNVWQLPVSTLAKVLTSGKHTFSPQQWTEMTPTPNHGSALLQATDPVVVGGYEDSSKLSSDVAVYDRRCNKWSTVGQLLLPCRNCTVVCISRSSFLVMGGRIYSDENYANSTQFSRVAF